MSSGSAWACRSRHSSRDRKKRGSKRLKRQPNRRLNEGAKGLSKVEPEAERPRDFLATPPTTPDACRTPLLRAVYREAFAVCGVLTADQPHSRVSAGSRLTGHDCKNVA